MINDMNRVMSLDVGDSKIGIAMTDLLGLMAQPYKTLRYADENIILQQIKEIIINNNVNKLVVGLPKNMDNSEGKQAEKTRYFVKRLQELISIDVEYIDERLTTKKALNDLSYLKIKKIKKKNILDTQAAINILDTYLSLNNR